MVVKVKQKGKERNELRVDVGEGGDRDEAAAAVFMMWGGGGGKKRYRVAKHANDDEGTERLKKNGRKE